LPVDDPAGSHGEAKAAPGPRKMDARAGTRSSRSPRPGPIPENHAPLPKWWWDQTLEVRRAVAVVVLVLLVGGVAALISRSGSSDEPGIAEQLSPVALEAQLYVAALPAPRIATWEDLAECESEGDWAAATGNGFYGGLQFSQGTWLEFGGSGSPHEATREEQIMRAESVQAVQGWNAWPRCSATLGLS
jgi:hypothetical protein